MNEQGKGKFPTTHWTLIARLKSGDEEASRKALDEICAQYHYPLYCYIRWRGLNHHDAQDALHDFLARLLRLESLKTAEMEKGRLRTFLATALQRFLINRHRDGQCRAHDVSLDADVEERFQREAFADEATPEKVLDQSWAETVLRTALDHLAAEETKAGRGEPFALLAGFLSPDQESENYESVAAKLSSPVATVRQMVKRLRDKFRTHLRQRVAETLNDPTADQIDDEMRMLRAAMAK